MTSSPPSALRVGTLPVERIAEVEPVWRTLHAHHGNVTPRLAGHTLRDADLSWRHRLDTYRQWLAQPDAFALSATRTGRLVGYAVVTVGKGFSSWQVGTRMADLGALAVLPDERRRGVGSAMMDELERRLVALGVSDIKVVTTAANDSARRFYERRGLEPSFRMFFGSIGEH